MRPSRFACCSAMLSPRMSANEKGALQVPGVTNDSAESRLASQLIDEREDSQRRAAACMDARGSTRDALRRHRSATVVQQIARLRQPRSAPERRRRGDRELAGRGGDRMSLLLPCEDALVEDG